MAEIRSTKSSLRNLVPPNQINHFSTKYVTLTENRFGTVHAEDGPGKAVKIFTWKNQNRIEVQVITFGARITSMKLPNRGGTVEDIVLGFDDLSGYMYYDDLYLGAMIGRTSNTIEKSIYVVDNKQYWLEPNVGEDHCNGGLHNFSIVNWDDHVVDNKLILSHCFKDGEGGHQGDLFVQITFELTPVCEFNISIVANTTKTCLVDISNKMFFNLAGHEAGEAEVGNHVVLLNSNCYTPYNDDGLPTGEILNVINTRFDFQTPKVLKKVMGLDFDNGYDQNYCVNRGVDQGNAFVARITHPQSGRILEVYSNQRGVNLNTAVDFTSGQVDIPVSYSTYVRKSTEDTEIFTLVHKLEDFLKVVLEPGQYTDVLKLLVSKLGEMSSTYTADDFSFVEDLDNVDYTWSSIMKPLEYQVLAAMKDAIPKITANTDFTQLKDIINDILIEQINGGLQGDANEDEVSEYPEYLNEIFDRQLEMVNRKSLNERHSLDSIKPMGYSCFQVKDEGRSKSGIKVQNMIPKNYKDGRIHGKKGVIYKRHAAISLQTQNYPNAVHHKNFPSPILRPNETYTHTITYKFWIQSGNPKRWLHRMQMENDPCRRNLAR